MKKNSTEIPLNPNDILMREFDYASQTAFQANEDRVKVFSYYLGSATTLIAATIFPDFEKPLHLYIFMFLFLGFYILGVFSFLKIIKLRLAWTNSVIAMNEIKEFYIGKLSGISLEAAFKWRMNSIPNVGKKWTIAFLMYIVTAFLASLSLSLSVLLLFSIIRDNFLYEVGLATFFGSLLFHLLLWEFLSRRR